MPVAALCWDCGQPLTARVLVGVCVLLCLVCDAGTVMPLATTDADVRCGQCGRYIAEAMSRPWAFRCPRCGYQQRSGCATA